MVWVVEWKLSRIRSNQSCHCLALVSSHCGLRIEPDNVVKFSPDVQNLSALNLLRGKSLSSYHKCNLYSALCSHLHVPPAESRDISSWRTWCSGTTGPWFLSSSMTCAADTHTHRGYTWHRSFPTRNTNQNVCLNAKHLPKDGLWSGGALFHCATHLHKHDCNRTISLSMQLDNITGRLGTSGLRSSNTTFK